MNTTHAQLIHSLRVSGTLNTPRIIEAFQAIDRKNFVSPLFHDEAYANHPLPIGGGQTISQPETVAFMLELLQPMKGQRILDIGSGSGWTSALLAHMTGDDGMVIARERIPELVARSKSILMQYHLNIDLDIAGTTLGAPEFAPFERILVSASTDALPTTLIEQLQINGVLVIPIQDAIHKITKTESGFNDEVYPDYLFVPLITETERPQ